MNTPTLHTERLILRRFTEEDLEAIYQIYRDEEVNRFLPWFPIKTMEEARQLYEKKYVQCYREERGYRYAICQKGDNRPIGYVHVSTEDSYDFGYGLCRELWHKGIATEAGKAVIRQLQRDGIPYITATHDINNPRSGQVMRRLGMRYQYSYEELWQPKDFLVTFRMYQRNLDGDDSRVYRGYWNQYPVHFVEEGMHETLEACPGS